MCAQRDRTRKKYVIFSLCYFYEELDFFRSLFLSPTEFQQARIWDYFYKQKHEILEDSNKTLENSELQMDQDVSTLVSGCRFTLEMVEMLNIILRFSPDTNAMLTCLK